MVMGCKCLYWNRIATSAFPPEPHDFSLPAPLPDWPPGGEFASGRINLGEIEVLKVPKFEFIWSSNFSRDSKKGVSFYKPSKVPDGFHCLGHYCQSNNQPLRGYLLAAREATASGIPANLPPLQRPLDYTLVWSSDDGSSVSNEPCGYFWLPQVPEGYMPLGFLVTNTPEKPGLDEARCVRSDLTVESHAHTLLLEAYSELTNTPFRVWSTRPAHRGMMANGVLVGTFFCSSYSIFEAGLNIVCLKNLDAELHAMPNNEQIHSLIKNYGPTVFFHPKEIYLPSSVPWFFKNGALLYKDGNLIGEPIDSTGSSLPGGGTNDGEFWIDLPSDHRREMVKHGNLESARLYVHVKPAFGGTFTDIAMWIFCPFNGPATLKIGPVNLALGKIGEHVGDWEHYTLRISNFAGELWSIYFSQHSGGQWVEAYDLEYIEGNKAIVYSSRNGHSSYPHPGTYIQGSATLGIGIRNDAARSNLFVDSSKQYEIIAAEYVGGDMFLEPGWLQFMREWGPTIVYKSRTEINKIVQLLPVMLRYSVETLFNKLPVELYGEEGPTGPKEKDNWLGDERS